MYIEEAGFERRTYMYFFFWEGGGVRKVKGGSLSTRGEIANGSVTEISCAGVCLSFATCTDLR